MSHFYATITNPSTGKQSTRCGHRQAGLQTVIQGHTTGIKVIARFEPEFNCDVFYIYRTRGESKNPHDTFIDRIPEYTTPL